MRKYGIYFFKRNSFPEKIQFIKEKIEICGNYLNFLQFPNLKKNSFRGNYMRKYGNLTILKIALIFLEMSFF